MDKETIIRLAREAGFADGVVEIVGLEGFSRFAALVAAREREECAKAVEVMALANPGMMYMTADQCATIIRNRGT